MELPVIDNVILKNYVTWRWGHRTSLDDGVEVDNNSSSLINDFNLGTSGKISLYLKKAV